MLKFHGCVAGLVTKTGAGLFVVNVITRREIAISSQTPAGKVSLKIEKIFYHPPFPGLGPSGGPVRGPEIYPCY